MFVKGFLLKIISKALLLKENCRYDVKGHFTCRQCAIILAAEMVSIIFRHMMCKLRSTIKLFHQVVW